MAGSVDVVVVGGGFAGVTASRELANSGFEVVLVEARDRLGGRTWVDQRLETELEMGGMSVHWMQPHVWSELARYGLELAAPPDLERANWLVDGERRQGTFDDLCDALDGPLTAFFADARDVFPHPYSPYAELESVNGVDGETFADRADRLDLSAEERGLLHAFWTLQFQGPPEEGALTQCLRWGALAGGEWRLLFEVLAGYELPGGTGELIDAIVNDGGFECRLSSAITEVAVSDGGVRLITRDGEELFAKVAVVAVPLNILEDISFDPSLPPAAAEVAREKQVSRGLKVWARIAGRVGPWCAIADEHPLTWIATSRMEGDESLLMGLGPDVQALDPNDRDAVQRSLEVLLPDAQVLSSTGHDWVADPYAKGTWAMLRPRQLTRLRDLRALPGPIFVCGSDFADGWAGFIDGGIESGLVTAGKVRHFLRHERPSTPSLRLGLQRNDR